MKKRFLSLWFPHLPTDWFTIRQPSLAQAPFVLAAPDHGRMLITAVNALALREGISPGLPLADARAIIPQVAYKDHKPELNTRLLSSIAKWCTRYTPIVSIDLPDGLILDISGCCHLWKGEQNYLGVIVERMTSFGYTVRASIADTVGASWAAARFSNQEIIPEGGQSVFMAHLSPAALRLPAEMVSLLEKLGLATIEKFMNMPPAVLRRRFGDLLLLRLHQACGHIDEAIMPVIPVCPYEERLISFEPIATSTGIEIGLKKLLERICRRLQQEQKGCRQVKFTTYSIDQHRAEITIGTHRPSADPGHLFKLFEDKIKTIDPGLGIEVFVIAVIKSEDSRARQEKIWDGAPAMNTAVIGDLVDRITNKIGYARVYRCFPSAHHWPERSVTRTDRLPDTPSLPWQRDKPRPVMVLASPEAIQVSAPLPDYPPMIFRYKGKIHRVKKSDGPERIECEWWIQESPHRDYYCVENEAGERYWIFRSGHYSAGTKDQWFIHGFFA